MSGERTIGREAVWGTLRIFAADALVLPTGLVTTAYLTRTLGPGGYGIYALAAAIVIWVEWTVTAVFTRATLKLVAEAEDWRPIGATVTWVHLITGVAAAAIVAAVAGLIADLLGVPALGSVLRILALDIPIACVATAHRNLLVGVGRYGARAAASAVRVIVRLVLIIALVAAGWSVTGVVIGVIVSSAVEIIVARMVVRPGWWRDPGFAVRRVREVAIPLFLYAASIRVLDKLDVLALQRLGGSVDVVGIYAAAQNLAVAPGLFAMALSSLLLSMLGRLLRQGDVTGAHELARGAMRSVVLLVPFAALAVAGAGPLVRVVFGEAFAAGAPVFAYLIVAATGFLMLGVTSAILTAGDRAVDAVKIAVPVVLAAFVGYVVAIPSLGAVGAALVTAVVGVAGGVASVVAVRRMWGVAPHVTTAVRSAIVAAVMFATAAATVPRVGSLAALGILAVLALAVPGSFLALGELTRRDLATLGLVRQ